MNYILPRFIRLRDAPIYLGMDRNRFNHEVRPSLIEIRIGQQGVAFDRLDLDNWAEHYKQCAYRPKTLRGELWVENKRQGSSNVASIGTLKRKSLDGEYEALLAQSLMKKLKPSLLIASKK